MGEGRAIGSGREEINEVTNISLQLSISKHYANILLLFSL